MAAETKRRALRGYTHDPWPCCGTTPGNYGRPKGGICRACGDLITEGKRSREALAAQPVEVYRWTEVAHGWPRYYRVPGHFRRTSDERDAHRELADAMFALVNRLAVPAPATTPPVSPKFVMEKRWDGKMERRNLPWPTVFPVAETAHSAWSFNQFVLLPPATREALVQLDAGIRLALEDRYEAGRERGRSILQGLVDGDTSLLEFEQSGLTERERQSRR